MNLKQLLLISLISGNAGAPQIQGASIASAATLKDAVLASVTVNGRAVAAGVDSVEAQRGGMTVGSAQTATFRAPKAAQVRVTDRVGAKTLTAASTSTADQFLQVVTASGSGASGMGATAAFSTPDAQTVGNPAFDAACGTLKQLGYTEADIARLQMSCIDAFSALMRTASDLVNRRIDDRPVVVDGDTVPNATIETANGPVNVIRNNYYIEYCVGGATGPVYAHTLGAELANGLGLTNSRNPLNQNQNRDVIVDYNKPFGPITTIEQAAQAAQADPRLAVISALEHIVKANSQTTISPALDLTSFFINHVLSDKSARAFLFGRDVNVGFMPNPYSTDDQQTQTARINAINTPAALTGSTMTDGSVLVIRATSDSQDSTDFTVLANTATPTNLAFLGTPLMTGPLGQTAYGTWNPQSFSQGLQAYKMLCTAPGATGIGKIAAQVRTFKAHELIPGGLTVNAARAGITFNSTLRNVGQLAWNSERQVWVAAMEGQSLPGIVINPEAPGDVLANAAVVPFHTRELWLGGQVSGAIVGVQHVVGNADHYSREKSANALVESLAASAPVRATLAQSAQITSLTDTVFSGFTAADVNKLLSALNTEAALVYLSQSGGTPTVITKDNMVSQFQLPQAGSVAVVKDKDGNIDVFTYNSSSADIFQLAVIESNGQKYLQVTPPSEGYRLVPNSIEYKYLQNLSVTGVSEFTSVAAAKTYLLNAAQNDAAVDAAYRGLGDKATDKAIIDLANKILAQSNVEVSFAAVQALITELKTKSLDAPEVNTLAVCAAIQEDDVNAIKAAHKALTAIKATFTKDAVAQSLNTTAADLIKQTFPEVDTTDAAKLNAFKAGMTDAQKSKLSSAAANVEQLSDKSIDEIFTAAIGSIDDKKAAAREVLALSNKAALADAIKTANFAHSAKLLDILGDAGLNVKTASAADLLLAISKSDELDAAQKKAATDLIKQYKAVSGVDPKPAPSSPDAPTAEVDPADAAADRAVAGYIAAKVTSPVVVKPEFVEALQAAAKRANATITFTAAPAA